MTEIVLASLCVVLAFLFWRRGTELHKLRSQTTILEKQLAAALERISELEDHNTNGAIEKVVQGLVGLGVPGLVLLVAVATSGYAGAAALTSALATLGGPLGMIGGIAVLLLLVPTSRAIAKYGLPRISALVIRGLAKEHSPEEIRDRISKYPAWVISKELRSKINELLSEEHQKVAAASR